MTLREGLIELTEQLREQGKMVVLLDAMLAQTAAADAEQSRLARIGELVEGLADRGLTVSISDGEAYAGRPYTGEHLPDPIGVYDHTLLDALEALKQKTEGL